MTYEGLRLKVNKIIRDKFADKRKKQLEQSDFTIISNNCWAGTIYESYNIKKMTPTVGLFFMAEDYIKFIENIHEYINEKLKFIEPNNSRWLEYVKRDNRYGTYPVGKLKDIEIFFLHYKSPKEALEKWERRCKRINWDKLIIKFNDQNMCQDSYVKRFFELPYKNKIFFTVKEWEGINNYIKVKQIGNKDFIRASYEPFGKNKYIDLEKLINSL